MSAVVVVAAVQTIQSELQTPIAGVLSTTKQISWENGGQVALRISAPVAPILGWVGLLSPSHPAWAEQSPGAGGPLWALEPVLGKFTLILGVGLLVVLYNFFLIIMRWFLNVWDAVVKFIELFTP
jgi:hypothetical protein